MSRLVDEPALTDPEEAFLASRGLAAKPSFQKARGNLLSYVDRMARDEVSFDDARRNLRALEDEYNTAVHDFRIRTWKRRAAILVPVVGGAGAAAAGGGVLAPLVAKGLGAGTSWTLKRLTGRLVPDATDPEEVHPGRAIALVRAASPRGTATGQRPLARRSPHADPRCARRPLCVRLPERRRCRFGRQAALSPRTGRAVASRQIRHKRVPRLGDRRLSASRVLRSRERGKRAPLITTCAQP